ncbi:MAG: peptidyl-prolyl cis-trans isomerase [Proteobacteria bacterium]|nr:peptidyl-prolyl cis-trans isomerase [Pseudomonadota bacterium]
MLQFFRSFFSSKLGIFVTLAFVGLIALSFAGGDVAGSGAFGGVTGSDRVASVGRERISTSDLERAASNSVEQLREENPKMTMKTFVSQGGLEQLLGNLIDLSAVRAFGEKYGVFVGKRLVDSEIAKIPAAQGPDGKVNEAAYRAFLAQKRVTDDQLRRQITEAMMAREMLSPAEIGLTAPKEAVNRYVGVLAERRIGAIALLPSAVFAPKSAPTDAEIAAWYASHKADYVLPERRVIRYATFTDAAVKNVPAPTDAEVAAVYEKNKAMFAASETRKVTQLVVPTEAAAKVLLAELGTGKGLEAVAAEKGLTAGPLGDLTKQALSGQTSQAIADAAFSASKGALIGPFKAPLGWTLLRVDTIQTKPGRTLDQARGEITAELAKTKQRAALTDFSARIEDEFDKGAALSDVAKELGLTPVETPPMLADGSLFGQPGKTAPPQLAKVVASAFAMEGEKQPQLAEVEPGKTFVVYDVSSIAKSAPPPLAEIKAVVASDVQLSKGAVAAKAAAQKVDQAAQSGTSLAAAMAALGIALPPVQPVDMPRQQLQAMRGNVPPPLALLFSMAKGKTKLLGAPRSRGWYVVQLKDAIPGKVPENNPQVAEFGKSIGQLQASEYSQQLRTAMRNEVGVKRNEATIAKVRNQLAGTAGSGN